MHIVTERSGERIDEMVETLGRQTNNLSVSLHEMFDRQSTEFGRLMDSTQAQVDEVGETMERQTSEITDKFEKHLTKQASALASVEVTASGSKKLRRPCGSGPRTQPHDADERGPGMRIRSTLEAQAIS